MFGSINKSVVHISFAFSLSAFALASSAAGSEYRDFPAIEKQLAALAQQHPDRLKLETIGKSAGGRALVFVQIADKGVLAANKRPALFVCANIAGFHHAGTEAAMHLIETLANSKDKKIEDLLATRTLYVAPLLNPDAHQGLFARPRQLRAGNDGTLDRDLDGLIAEDGADDLDGNGIITQMRIKDANGDMLVDPEDARRMIKADASKGLRGTHRVFMEGNDDDHDGLYSEDGAGGVHPDRNFAAGFAVADAEAGKWPGIAPESKAIMDALLAHKNIAMAVVYGPANQLLAAPKGYERPTPAGAKPSDEANRLEADDLKTLASLGENYKKALELAGLDTKRNAKQTGAGSLANWLYFHYGVQTLELDVWGIPKSKSGKETPAKAPDLVANLSTPVPPNAGLLPPRGNSKRNDTPAAGTVDVAAAANDRDKDLMAYIDANAPEAFIPWKAVTLADGTKAEVGGIDATTEYTPPAKMLTPAIAVHTEQVLAWAGKLAQLEILETKLSYQGDDLWLVTAVGGIQGELPTHSKLATRMKNKIPVRMEMKLGKGVTSMVLNRAVVAESLNPASTIKGEWLVKGAKGSTVEIALWCNQAGQVRTTLTLSKEN